MNKEADSTPGTVIIGSPPRQTIPIGANMPILIAGELVSTSEIQEIIDCEMALLKQQSKTPFIIKPHPTFNEPIFIDDSKKRKPHEYRTHGGHRKHGHKRRNK